MAAEIRAMLPKGKADARRRQGFTEFDELRQDITSECTKRRSSEGNDSHCSFYCIRSSCRCGRHSCARVFLAD